MNQQLPDSSDEIQIQIEAMGQPEVPEGPDPVDDDDVRLVKVGQPGGEVRAFISYPCLKQVLAHIQRHLDCEVGGVLLGAICRSRLGLVTAMAEAVPAVRTEADAMVLASRMARAARRPAGHLFVCLVMVLAS